jgi:trafficking protein particle complex subunit 1
MLISTTPRQPHVNLHTLRLQESTSSRRDCLVEEQWCCTPSQSLTDIVSPLNARQLKAGESVYHRQWNTPANQTKTPSFISPGPPVQPTQQDTRRIVPATNKHEDDAKLLFGVVYSLRNMTRKLSTPYPLSPCPSRGLIFPHVLASDLQTRRGFWTIIVEETYRSDDNFISYRTSKYKLHYYETPTLLKFVMITDAKADSKRVVLHQIYVNLYVEFVVKNPLREIDGPVGVETFHLALDQFVRTLVYLPVPFPNTRPT